MLSFLSSNVTGQGTRHLVAGTLDPIVRAAILVIHIAGSCATSIISQQILVTRLLENCGEAISVSATIMTVNADNIMKRVHQSVLLRMRRQGRTRRTPYSASSADCVHVMLYSMTAPMRKNAPARTPRNLEMYV